MPNFPSDRYNLNSLYVLTNGYYIEIKANGPEYRTIVKTPEGAPWKEGVPSAASTVKELIEDEIALLQIELNDPTLTLNEIVSPQPPPPVNTTNYAKFEGRVVDEDGNPIPNAKIEFQFFGLPQAPPPPKDDEGYTDLSQVVVIPPALVIDPGFTDSNGIFALDYGLNQINPDPIDFETSYIKISKTNYNSVTKGPVLVKNGEVQTTTSTSQNSSNNSNNNVNLGPTPVTDEELVQLDDGSYKFYITIEATQHGLTSQGIGVSLNRETAKKIARSNAEKKLKEQLQNTKNSIPIEYDYATGFRFDNNGNASSISVLVDNNVGLPIFERIFSNVTFTLESAEESTKFQLDSMGDFRNNIAYPKTGTPIDREGATPQPPEPKSPDEITVTVDIYDLGKIILKSSSPNIEPIQAEVITQVNEEEAKLILQGFAPDVPFEVKMVTIYNNKKESLKRQLIPFILALIAKFGPNVLNSILSGNKNPLEDKVCLSAEELKEILRKRNKVTKKINNAYKWVRTLSKILGVTNALILGLKIATKIAQGLTAVPGPFKPPFFGLKDIWNGLVEQGFLTIDTVLRRAGVAVTALNIATTGIGVVLGYCLRLLQALDDMIIECAQEPDVEGGQEFTLSFEEINEEINSFIESDGEQVDDLIDPLTNQPLPYKGFTFEIKQDTSQNFQYPKRYALARNIQGIQVLRSESSYASNPSVLIEELRFVIDRDNLRAD